jgi:hypothetical protein
VQLRCGRQEIYREFWWENVFKSVTGKVEKEMGRMNGFCGNIRRMGGT